MTRPNLFLAILPRTAFFMLAWVGLTRAEPGALLPGALVVAAVVVLSLRLLPPRPLSLPSVHLLPLAGFAAREAVLGGWDVAWRALLPGQRLDPAMFRYRLRYPHGRSVLPMAYLLSALPGTLTVEVEDGELEIHVLDRGQDVQAMLADLERRLAAALPERKGGAHG
ncbi:Na+/H+ antiporter subunit E [Telmatospirillum sp. J64-1]|uniref:Na+/H+ antiporter subunit E n=1 Tax=Telmatospirillum sp. J64-1 TaxID=2502183 RepID=UPI00163D468F|nr:Na+/H+ antiporter subunit E [Telmatospirillum sp. J64-1]